MHAQIDGSDFNFYAPINLLKHKYVDRGTLMELVIAPNINISHLRACRYDFLLFPVLFDEHVIFALAFCSGSCDEV